MTTHVIALPKWVIVLRSFQSFFAVVILGLSAYGLYWVAFTSWGFALFTSLATFIIVLYGSLTARITSWQVAYNYWAIITLDAVAIIFWLSSMAALAATRATFTIPTEVDGCVNYGSGGICYKRDLPLGKREYVATNGYLSMMSGAAGLSGLEMLLFIATLTITSVSLKRQRFAAIPNTSTPGGKLESHPMNAQSYDPVQYQYQQESENQYQYQQQNQTQTQNQDWSQYQQQYSQQQQQQQH